MTLKQKIYTWGADAVKWLISYQKRQQAAGNDIQGWCLKTTRLAIESVGYRIARAGTALESYHLMIRDPEAYGWKQVGHLPGGGLVVPCLAYFNGHISHGVEFGHVGILAKDEHGDLVIYSDQNLPFDQEMADRLLACFVPIS